MVAIHDFLYTSNDMNRPLVSFHKGYHYHHRRRKT